MWHSWNMTSEASEFFSVWRSSLVIPAYFSASSVVVFLLHIVSSAFQNNRNKGESGSEELKSDQRVGSGHVEVHGGSINPLYHVARLVGCIAVLGLSIAIAVLCRPAAKGTGVESRFLHEQLAQCICAVRQ